MFRFASLVFIVLLAGCVTTKDADTPLSPGPFPENYEELVNDLLKNSLKDPYSVRDLNIPRPHEDRIWLGLMKGGEVDAWRSCVSYNAKNSYGAYVGVKYFTFVFKDGQILHILRPNSLYRGGC